MALDRVHRNDHGFSIAIVSSESLMNTIHGQVGTKQPEVVFPLAIYQKSHGFLRFQSPKNVKDFVRKNDHWSPRSSMPITPQTAS